MGGAEGYLCGVPVWGTVKWVHKKLIFSIIYCAQMPFMYNIFHSLRGKKTFIVKNWANNKSNIVT